MLFILQTPIARSTSCVQMPKFQPQSHSSCGLCEGVMKSINVTEMV